MVIAVDCANGSTVKSSPIPISAIEEVFTEVAEAEVGAPIHLWIGDGKALVVIPHSQIEAIRVLFL